LRFLRATRRRHMLAFPGPASPRFLLRSRPIWGGNVARSRQCLHGPAFTIATEDFEHESFREKRVLEYTIKQKYVNMADIIFFKIRRFFAAGVRGDDAYGARADLGPDRAFVLAYRDFVSDPDTCWKNSGFGRAHHRVMHSSIAIPA